MISIASCHECDWMAGAFYDGESTRLEFSCSSSFWRNASVSNDGFSLIKTSLPSGRRGRRWKNRVVRGSLDPGVRRTPRIEKFTCKRVVMPDYSREVFWQDAVGFCYRFRWSFRTTEVSMHWHMLKPSSAVKLLRVHHPHQCQLELVGLRTTKGRCPYRCPLRHLWSPDKLPALLDE